MTKTKPRGPLQVATFGRSLNRKWFRWRKTDSDPMIGHALRRRDSHRQS